MENKNPPLSREPNADPADDRNAAPNADHVPTCKAEAANAGQTCDTATWLTLGAHPPKRTNCSHLNRPTQVLLLTAAQNLKIINPSPFGFLLMGGEEDKKRPRFAPKTRLAAEGRGVGRAAHLLVEAAPVPALLARGLVSLRLETILWIWVPEKEMECVFLLLVPNERQKENWHLSFLTVSFCCGVQGKPKGNPPF